ncbi:MAG: diguanylate cyclase, partial [Thermoanaerobaculia bacterium]|nr:diguanylate cyclase [Thermoanaerobaculia bacterium]
MGTGVSPGFFLWLDEEGVVVRAEGTGASSVEGVGRAFRRTIHPDDQERILEALDGPRPTSDLDGGPIALDFRRRTEEGWQKVRGLALPVEDGWILGCRASREESSSDDELRDKLQRYRLLFRQSPVGVLHYDTDLRVSDVNESLCRILRSSREKLVGLDMKELRDTRVLPALEAALRGEHGRYEGQYRATYSSAEVWVSLRTVPFHDARGRVRGGIGIAEDITERKEGERIQRALYRLSEAVHEAEDLAALFETIHRTLGRLMPAENIYLALYDEETRSLRFPYFVDERDEPPEGSLPLGRGVTEYVLRTEEALLAGPDDLTSLERAGEIELRGALPASWLGVPLKVGQEATGVLALQSYDPEVRFGEKERSVLAFVAEQVAMTVERKRQEAQIARMAYYDLLTSLPNRRMLQEKVPHFLAMGRRKGWPVSLLYLDLDRFKMINDTLGHDAGDQLLVAIARELERCVRASDLLGRLGGDEFAFVMSEAGPEEATRLARRVVEVLDRPFVVRGERVHVGCSIGIAVFPEHGETLEELLKHADIAMYRAKDSGVEYSVFDSEWSPYSRERLALEAELREAVAEERLVLAYQPVFRVADGSRAGVEALVRWPREGEEVPAAELVSLAE